MKSQCANTHTRERTHTIYIYNPRTRTQLWPTVEKKMKNTMNSKYLNVCSQDGLVTQQKLSVISFYEYS